MGKSTISMTIFNRYVCLPESNVGQMDASLNLDHPFNSILGVFVVLDPLPDYYFLGALEILTGA